METAYLELGFCFVQLCPVGPLDRCPAEEDSSLRSGVGSSTAVTRLPSENKRSPYLGASCIICIVLIKYYPILTSHWPLPTSPHPPIRQHSTSG